MAIFLIISPYHLVRYICIEGLPFFNLPSIPQCLSFLLFKEAIFSYRFFFYLFLAHFFLFLPIHYDEPHKNHHTNLLKDPLMYMSYLLLSMLTQFDFQSFQFDSIHFYKMNSLYFYNYNLLAFLHDYFHPHISRDSFL